MNILKSRIGSNFLTGLSIAMILVVFATRIFMPKFNNEMDNKGMLLILICLFLLLLVAIHKWFVEYHSGIIKCAHCKTWVPRDYQDTMVTRRGERFCSIRCADVAHPDLGATIWEHRWRMHLGECPICILATATDELCSRGHEIFLAIQKCRTWMDDTEHTLSHFYVLERRMENKSDIDVKLQQKEIVQ